MISGEKTIEEGQQIEASGEIREGAIYSIGENIIIECDERQYILKRKYKNKSGNMSNRIIGYYPYLSLAVEQAAEQCFKEKALKEAVKEIAVSISDIEDSREWVKDIIKKIK